MNQSDKKPCIQKRIKLWFSNLRFEQKLFLFVIGGMVFFYAYIFIFLQSIFLQFLVEFTAGFLGILIGFYLNRQNELRKKIGITKQIINNLLVELNNNLVLVKEMKHIIKPSRIEYFQLFQTNTWDMFSSKLELDNMEILFDLGSIYHRFQLFNAGMKLESLGGELSSILKRKPDFFKQLEKDLENIVGRLDSLKL